MYSFNQSDCVPCPKNTYQPMKGQVKCRQCPHGTMTYTDDRHVYINDCKEECRPGYYFNLSEMVCTKCPRNSTQENKGQITCDMCPINLPITEKEGTVFQSDCIQNCNAGSYLTKQL
ncbi:signal peptide, CUB and EGF-like domain-containing protein 2 isoform X2 [Xenia sp. Carnegie-2017]|uniref:signal peptide, CUB and EGF-like domain-containing protein 2 isoform X2 n=1 Tax=Xenia sp. Carnegie-2017 TaxID=2897299 RepID=UPI001F03DCA6|nr:signal peptide, CUB and EGF-like domain-containing protein 2 isoform X2 [Xenia sp. Carnegie-2017]